MNDLVWSNPPYLGIGYTHRAVFTELAERAASAVTKDDIRAIIAEEIAKALRSAPSTEADRRVDINEMAKISGLSTHYLYHNSARLPFAKKLGHKTLRFSVQGFQRWDGQLLPRPERPKRPKE
jgi:hypothetical protein